MMMVRCLNVSGLFEHMDFCSAMLKVMDYIGIEEYQRGTS